MPFNNTGVFVRLYNWVNDAANSIKISSSRMDTEMNGFATGLSDCVTRDGQSPWLANLPAGGFKITGLGPGSGSGDSLAWDNFLATAWTPAFAGSSVAGSPTYSPSPPGRYWKFGNLVLAMFSLRITAFGGATGSGLITGLPFAANAAAPQGQVFFGGTAGIAADASRPLISGLIALGTSYISVVKEGSVGMAIGTDMTASPCILEGGALYSS